MSVKEVIRQKLGNVPHKPGVYLHKDRFGTVIYVGKARDLRKNATDAERRLWSALRTLNPRGTRFRRQVPIGAYIADFCCHSLNLIIEVDGGQHNESAATAIDAVRTAFLQSRGYTVLRFWNNDVLQNLDGVMTRIGAFVATPTPNPSPQGGGDGEGPPRIYAVSTR